MFGSVFARFYLEVKSKWLPFGMFTSCDMAWRALFWLTKLVSLSNGLWLARQAQQNPYVRSNKTTLVNTEILYYKFFFCSWWPPGFDLGHTANATRNWRSDTGLHGWRRNKPNTVVVHAAGLDSYLLQQLSGNSTSVEKKRQKQLLIWTENACYLFEAK